MSVIKHTKVYRVNGMLVVADSPELAVKTYNVYYNEKNNTKFMLAGVPEVKTVSVVECEYPSEDYGTSAIIMNTFDGQA